MGHYAKVLSGKVIDLIVAKADFFESFVDSTPGEWIKTSYNTRGGIHYKSDSNEPSEDQSKALRKNYAGIGFTYNQQKDAFIPPCDYPSWTLNEETCLWEAPSPYPNDGKFYVWDENQKTWVSPGGIDG
jgi:hypothetical protein